MVSKKDTRNSLSIQVINTTKGKTDAETECLKTKKPRKLTGVTKMAPVSTNPTQESTP